MSSLLLRRKPWQRRENTPRTRPAETVFEVYLMNGKKDFAGSQSVMILRCARSSLPSGLTFHRLVRKPADHFVDLGELNPIAFSVKADTIPKWHT
jgi:hypothetical protein